MVKSHSKDNKESLLIYQNSILTLDKDDSFTFIIENEYLNYKIRFNFSDEGKKFSTTFWEDPEKGYLLYQLNNWDSSTYVEMSNPVEIKVLNNDSKFWMKFRNYSIENKNNRKFEINIWKEINNDNG
jgi:hypothetical protein